MKLSWVKKRVIRESGLVEDVCRHGIGHPAPESVKEMTKKFGDCMWIRHACDGCCIVRKKVKR